MIAASRHGDDDLAVCVPTLHVPQGLRGVSHRVRYVRYCDDFLLGFAGPKREAEEIKARIKRFLTDELKLELSESKTLVTHATSQAARFLGYEIRAQHADAKITRNRRAVNGASACPYPGPSSGNDAPAT